VRPHIRSASFDTPECTIPYRARDDQLAAIGRRLERMLAERSESDHRPPSGYAELVKLETALLQRNGRQPTHRAS
jgi:hypothetical protein